MDCSVNNVRGKMVENREGQQVKRTESIFWLRGLFLKKVSPYRKFTKSVKKFVKGVKKYIGKHWNF